MIFVGIVVVHVSESLGGRNDEIFGCNNDVLAIWSAFLETELRWDEVVSSVDSSTNW